MNLKNLETFVWVANLGSFRATAERLNATQPTISARIASLEDDLQVQLFDRSRNHVKLTSVGVELFAYAEKILALAAEMDLAIRDRATYHGVVRLGVSETFVHTWLPVLMQRLHEAYPRLTVELLVDVTIRLRDGLVARELDIAFLMGPVSEPTMRNRPLCRYALNWVASPKLGLPDRPIPLEELAQYPIITYPRETRPHVFIREAFRRPDLPPVRISGSSSLSTIIQLMVDGLGVGAVPPDTVRRELADGSLFVVRSDAALPDLEFTVTYPVSPPNPLAQIVAELAVEVAGSASERGDY